MGTALKIEMIKMKASNYLFISFFVPFIFLIFTVLTVLSSQNPTGLIDGVSIIQINIYNLWALLVLPITIVLVSSGDFQQEKIGRGKDKLLANDWSMLYQYWAKILKVWLLLLFSQSLLIIITVFSNLLTTGKASESLLLICVSLVIWIGTLPLIIINKILLCYFNTIVVSIFNIILMMLSVVLNIPLSNRFFLDPWTYALRTIALLRIKPNSTLFPKNSFYANDVRFIFLILVLITIWLIINHFIAIAIERGLKNA